MRTLAFFRDCQGFTGGHLKVWDYFRHTQQSQYFTPTIYFTEASRMDTSNPWVAMGAKAELHWDPRKADALFLGGMDWLAVPDDCTVPVINLVQHVRHGDATDPRYAFLCRRAMRLCVSKEVEIAILSTGKVNGPVITIPAGLNLDEFPRPSRERDIPLLIVGVKQPTLAKKLSEALLAEGVATTCLTSPLPRPEFLDMLGRANVSIMLPYEKEGFYLPALEGMAMGTLVVCPDCVGNREFCTGNVNCLMPSHSADGVKAAAIQALTLEPSRKSDLIHAARKTAANHALAHEREEFHKILGILMAGDI